MFIVLARHAYSELNAEHRVNGDPSLPVHITDEGREEARVLGLQLSNLPFDLCVHTRFGRTRETAALALAGRDVPVEVDPLLDDVYVGELEGVSVDEFRAWKAEHTRADRFPGGESLDDAARRYAEAYRRLLAKRPALCARRLPRDSDPIRAQRRGGLDQPRRSGARDSERNAFPVRRGVARTGCGPDRGAEPDDRRAGLADPDQQPLDDLAPGPQLGHPVALGE